MRPAETAAAAVAISELAGDSALVPLLGRAIDALARCDREELERCLRDAPSVLPFGRGAKLGSKELGSEELGSEEPASEELRSADVQPAGLSREDLASAIALHRRLDALLEETRRNLRLLRRAARGPALKTYGDVYEDIHPHQNLSQKGNRSPWLR